jgi:hypothetical protein
MIAIAQSRLPDASFHVGSLHDFDLPPCVAACGVGETLSYLRPGEARIDVRRLFSRIWHALEPGGTFLFDVVEAGRDEPMSSHACRSGPDWAVEAVVTEDVTRSVITRTITTRRTDGVHVRSTTEVHRVQVFSRTELDEALTGCGFRVEMDGTYRGVSLPPGRVGVIAKRPRR